MILVDTSVWVDHLRNGSADLSEALERGDVLTHPFVIGELACGHMKNRSEILGLLAALPSAVVGTDEETLHLIEHRKLMGKGIGYIDAHLVASVILTGGSLLWTKDKPLAAIAANLRLAHQD